jgi:hypothetical protein
MLRRLASLTAALAVSAALVIGMSGPASANGWNTSDGFEWNPAATWILYKVGTGGGGFDINAGTARTPYNNAWLSIQSSGWSSVGRSVHITPSEVHLPVCAARIYVLPLGTAKLNFEVIRPSTWTYLALKTVTLSGSTYQSVVTPSWDAYDNDVFVRVSLLYNNSFSAVRVDDMLVQCYYY